PGIGPSHAHLRETGRAFYGHVTDTEAFAAGLFVTQREGIIPALESAHAFAYLEKMTLKESDVVVVNVSGRGDKDLQVYLENLDLENGVVKLKERT
ncbi:MAG: tryptophan synthase beta subunit, partial [Polaribacter sp.]